MAIIFSVALVTTGIPEVGFGTQLWAVMLAFALVLLLVVVPIVVVVVWLRLDRTTKYNISRCWEGGHA